MLTTWRAAQTIVRLPGALFARSDQTVTKTLRTANTRIGDGRLREGDKQVRVFTGMKLIAEGKVLLRNDTAMYADRHA